MFEAFDVVVVGAGASGIMAAVHASESGARVLVLETRERPARKLLLTGKGRCNLGNSAPREEFLSHFAPDPYFLRQAFSRYFTEDMRQWFSSLGLPTVEERGGRIFPADGKAMSAADVMQRALAASGATLRPSSRVQSITVQGLGFVLSGQGFREKTRDGAGLILACGGASYPDTGSRGDGFEFAARLGHRVRPASPSLVGLLCRVPAGLPGLLLKNVGLSIQQSEDGAWRQVEEGFGELSFMPWGISGPLVLSASRRAVPLLSGAAVLRAVIDLKAALSQEKLEARLQRDFDAAGAGKLAAIMAGLLPKALAPAVLAQAGLDEGAKTSELSAAARRRLCNALKNLSFSIDGHRPLSEAIVTAGGVDTKEVDPRTMESRLVPGLFFCGEVLDVDADTGGFNLQAAFSTGVVAGRSAAEKALASRATS